MRSAPGSRAAALAALVLAAVPAAAEPPTGREIMERVDARDDGDNSDVQDLEMVLIDKRGASSACASCARYGRDVGEDKQSIMFFLSPADVEDTGFLTYDYDDPARDDDQWLYLPALTKTKRIASSDKSGSFMGSDFSYADMTERPLDHYDYTLMKEARGRGPAGVADRVGAEHRAGEGRDRLHEVGRSSCARTTTSWSAA